MSILKIRSLYDFKYFPVLASRCKKPPTGQPDELSQSPCERAVKHRGIAETRGLLPIHASDVRRILAEEFEALYSWSDAYRLLRRLGLSASGRRPSYHAALWHMRADQLTIRAQQHRRALFIPWEFISLGGDLYD